MRIITTKWARASVCLCALGLGLILSSCGGTNGTSNPTATSAALRGTAYGGRQPIVGSTVTVYEAGLTPGDGATQIGQTDTGPDGSFNIAAFNPVPAAGQIVYVVIQGGDAGGSFNGAIKLMTVAGAFGSAGFPNTVNINELTTVATIAMLQKLIALPDCGTVTGNTTLTATCVAIAGDLGLAKRAATVRNLVDVVGGQASVFLSAAAGGTPLNLTLQKLNSLADILAACVNSAGGTVGDGSACGNLFKIAPATDTLVAAFQIASSPVISAKGAALFALLAQPLVYTPAVSAAPASWTVGGQRFSYVANNGDSNVSAYTLDPVNGRLSPIAGSPFAAGNKPTSMAVDPSGRFAYVANAGDSNISAYTVDPASGALTPIAGAPFATSTHPQSITVDPSGRFAYVASDLNNTNNPGNVSAYTINPASGALSPIAGSPFATGIFPDAVTVDPSGKFAYVVNDLSRDVSAYTIDPASGALSPIAGQPFAAGVSPASVTVDPSGRFAYVANFDDLHGDNISAYTVDPASGALNPIAGQPFAAGVSPDSVTVDPTGRFAYVTDSGENKISAYAINSTSGALTFIAGQPYFTGSGPGPVTVDPSGKFAYTTNDGDKNISTYTIDPASGALSRIAGSSFAAGNAPSSVTVDPNGRFAYVANNSDDNVSAYTFDPASGALTPIAGSPFAAGNAPNSVTVDPSGQFAYVANGFDDNVSAYTINPASGTLTPVAGSPFAAGTFAQSVTVDPTGKFAYVANSFPGSDNNVSAYTIDPASGALTPVAGSPFAAGLEAFSVTVDPSGRFAYVANNGDSTVSAFTIDPAGGALSPIAGSPFAASSAPQSVTVDPSGKFAYVANHDDNSVSAYTINSTSGALTPVAGPPFAASTNPYSVTVDPSGKFAYVANYGENNVSTYTIDPTNGALNSIAGSPFIAGLGPQSVTVDPTGKFAYVANNIDNDVWAYTINPTNGGLTPIAGPSTGTKPVTVTVAP